MNHFRYPTIRNPEQTTAVYGNVATAELVRMMLESGSKIQNLAAQVLGGACSDETVKEPIGLQNVKVARQVLERKGIPIISEDTGGLMGRKVVFDTSTGHVLTLKVHKIRDEDWATDELSRES